MRPLLDENVPKAAVELVSAAGRNVLWIRTHAPGAADSEIVRLAAQEERIVTLDKDFRYLEATDALPDRWGDSVANTSRCSRGNSTSLVKEMDFGPWEQIFYGEFDGRRKKRVLVKIIGE